MEDFWLGILKIIFIDLVLSGDNAVVIALACRNLPANKRKKAVLWGTFGAVSLRVALTAIVVYVMNIPYLQVVGGLLLLWIAIKLLKGDDGKENITAGDSMLAAIKTIIVADFIMSLDNVVAVAGASGGHIILIILGLLISVPIIVWGSQVLMKLMNRFPIIVTIGAAILGYTAGELMLADKVVGGYIEHNFPIGHYTIPLTYAILVVLVGLVLNRRKTAEQ